MAFLSDSSLLVTDDGGIYAEPANTTVYNGQWVDLNENIEDTEFFSVAYDAQNGVIFGGTQDNGTPVQIPGGWDPLVACNCDGGAVAVDNSGSATTDYYFSDGSFQSLSNGSSTVIGLQGLNSTDQQTISNDRLNPPDASFFVAVNPFGPAPNSSTGLAPILLGGGIEGLTGLYESFTGGQTVTQVSAPTSSGNPSAFTYASAAGTAYYGTTSGQLFLRDVYGQAFTTMTAPNWGGNAYATQIVTDPKDPNVLYVLDDFGRIWGSIDQGAFGWTNLTPAGTNLATLNTATSVVNIGEDHPERTTTTVQTIQVVDPSPYTPFNNVILAGRWVGCIRSMSISTRFNPVNIAGACLARACPTFRCRTWIMWPVRAS